MRPSPGGTTEDPALDAFLEHRSLVRRLAYDITGSVQDAEDVAQEAYLKWRRADHAAIRDVRAYLARTATTLAVDRLRRQKRETYPGPWLVEPIPTGPDAPDAEDLAVRAEEIEHALLLALHELSVRERSAFLLHDVFSFGFAEVARILGSTPAAARQQASRARRRLRAIPVHAVAEGPATEQERRLLAAFSAAIRDADPAALIDLVAEDVRLVTDGGGKVTAARVPILGRDKVLRFLGGLLERYAGRVQAHPCRMNHRPGFLVTLDGALDQALVVHTDPSARIREISIVRNPEKLRHLRALVP
ncbi:MAG: sigma-70 family RNA polymerase sigma factor [Brachybacterium sp.]|nr:sigma-70 family RNA polymerase sigma factor [Brachybacterium sp.]